MSRDNLAVKMIASCSEKPIHFNNKLSYLLGKALHNVKNKGLKYTLKVSAKKAKIQLVGKRECQNVNNGAEHFNLDGKVFSFEDYKPDTELFSKIEQPIDIIVPIYNGFDIIGPLLNSIPRTALPYNLILIDDKSPDEKILPMLYQYQAEHDSVTVIENNENLGYTKSVNIGFQMSEGHVVLLNTDVRLPAHWLERLIAPIILDDKVATVTPFTNSGTICSFPNFCENNDLYLGLNVDEIDAAFSRLRPSYTEIPTGVGFCMAMSRKAIDTIGLYDEEYFPRGYAEENDWCQRAIKNGFKNIMAENLFVYHQHGATFLSEEKKKLIESHLQIVNQRYPNYESDVEKYFRADPIKPYRNAAKFLLYDKKTADSVVVSFNHAWGGGATSYLEEKQRECINAGREFILACYRGKSGFLLSRFSSKMTASICVDSISQLFALMPDKADQIWINELVSYPDLFNVQKKIVEYAQTAEARLVFRLHDFFSICPSIVMLDENSKFCGVCQPEKCNSRCPNQKQMEEWRRTWECFLSACDEITAFSNDSKTHMLTAYPNLDNICVTPHKITCLRTVATHERQKKLTIGVFGFISKQKGMDIILEMCKIIEKEQLPVKICIIGFPEDSYGKTSNYGCLYYTGPYAQKELPELVEQNKIDIVLIPSIWPETFSYTAEEAMMMGLPVAVFDIGAPVERVKLYDKGLIIEEIEAAYALQKIRDFMT